jgi:hypothetical protein
MWPKKPRGDVLSLSAEEAHVARKLIAESDKLLDGIQRDVRAVITGPGATGAAGYNLRLQPSWVGVGRT